MNVKHSKAYTDWHTPSWLVERCRRVLGEITFDPFSSPKAQLTVKANRYLTGGMEWKELRNWKYQGILVNPPTELVREAWEVFQTVPSLGSSALWIAYSIEQLQTLQSVDSSVPQRVAILNKRVKFVPGDDRKATSPSHANAVMARGLSEEQLYRFDEEFAEDSWVLESV